MFKGNLEVDPRGLIYEAYRIDGITGEECRTIFLDWAIRDSAGDMTENLQILLNEYEETNPDHPMNQVIKEGMADPIQKGRRGGARGRR